jgi:hypothetical protein
MVYWVVLRDFETGRLLNYWTCRNAKEAERKRYHLQENPTTPNCRIEVEVLWHPERPKEFA